MDALPIELFQYILLFNPGPPFPIVSPIRGLRGYAPLLVSHRWRDAVLSCPPLWTHIDLIFDRYEFLHWAPYRGPAVRTVSMAQIKRFREWLARSQDSDLHLNFEFPNLATYDHVQSSDISIILDMLLEHVSRWGSLRFLVRTDTRFSDHEIKSNLYWGKFYTPLADAIRLRSMRLHDAIWSDTSIPPAEEQFPPAVRTLAISGHPPRSFSWIRIAGDTATSLSLAHITTDLETIHCLGRDMPNIKRLELDSVTGNLGGVSTSQEVNLVPPRCVFRSLESLRFSTSGNPDLPKLLLHNSRASLRDVSIHFTARPRKRVTIPKADTFPYWAKRLPPNIVALTLTFSLDNGDRESDRELGLQLPGSTKHLVCLQSLDVVIRTLPGH